MANPRVLFLMADYGHDPTETAVPFLSFQKAGFDISVATERGKTPDCDARMLTGFTQKILGATKEVCDAYQTMKETPAFQKPLSWMANGFSLEPYSLIFLPGGHDKGVRQVIDSSTVHDLLGAYFPQTKKPSSKSVAAICHGVLVLAETTLSNRKSALHDVLTTTLPATFERTAYWGTWAFLGDYYKTYGVGSDDCETMVKRRLDDPKAQYKSSTQLSPFVVKDEGYNYVSGRFPADAALLAEAAISTVKESHKTT